MRHPPLMDTPRGMRIALALLGATLLVALADAALPRLVGGERSFARVDAERTDTFHRVLFRNFEEANENVNAGIARAHRRYQELPDEPENGELRVFLIGNSAALFAIVPDVLEKKLAAAHPDRQVRVFPFQIPDIGVQDEQVLTRAALRKNADVVILTPNLKGLIEGHEVRVRRVRELFADPDNGEATAGERTRRFLRRHWHTYALREELRPAVLRAFRGWLALPSAEKRERRMLERGFEAVRAGAAERDVAAVLTAYREHRLTKFVPTAIESRPLARQSPIFHTIAGGNGSAPKSGPDESDTRPCSTAWRSCATRGRVAEPGTLHRCKP